MTRIQKRIRAAVILALIIGGTILLCGHAKRSEPQEWESYTVRSGDTLWSISKTYAPANSDVREYIYLLCEHNGIGVDLQAGQVIELAK